MDIICAIAMVGIVVAFGGVTMALWAKISDSERKYNILNTSLNGWVDDLLSVKCDVEYGEKHLKQLREEFITHIRDHNKNVADTDWDGDGVQYWTNTRLISRDQFYLDHSGRKGVHTLYYHENTDRLESVYEDFDILDPTAVVGNYALKHFGERSGDPNTVYVRNITFNTDFKIVKVNSNNRHD